MKEDNVDMKRFILLVSVPAILILAFLGLNLRTTTFGDEIVLEVFPADSRDIFRGDYVSLRYEISTVRLNETHHDTSFSKGEAIYGTLSQKGGFWTLDSVSHDRPRTEEGQVFMKGRVTQSENDNVSIEWGIESYFLPEGEGRPLKQQMDGNLSAVVVVHSSGKAVLRELLTDGKALKRINSKAVI